MIVIIDYGIGNINSILNMLIKIGTEAVVSSDRSVIEKADKLILPGVGAFDYGMSNLKSGGFIELLDSMVVRRKVPVLGICLGMQLMTGKSEEGSLPGLGWIDAETKKFRFDGGIEKKVPHMGWNSVRISRKTDLFPETDEAYRFYFVHSYHVICNNDDDVLATTNYGYDFVSAFQAENIIGVQFHPEKSHKFGMHLLKGFAKL